MSVSILILEESKLAFNLNHVTKMELDKDGLYFIHDGIQYATYAFGNARRLRIHPSEPQCVINMWNKFINM
jgi:hypothetical protein